MQIERSPLRSSQRKNDLSGSRDLEQGQDGFALIAVLLFLLVATAIITPMVLAARTDFLLSSRDYLKTRHAVLAESILNIVSWELASLGLEKNEALLLNSEPMKAVCGSYAISITVQDQAGLIDINAAPERLLESGFQALGFSGSEARSLSEITIAYRTPQVNGVLPPRGADDLSNGLKYFAFEAIEEIYEFPGFSRMSPDQIAQVFTTYSKQGSVNSNVMSPLLSDLLPNEATGQFPFIISQEAPLLFGEIRVLVENVSLDARAFSGAMIEVPDANTGIYNVKERSIDPGILGGRKTFEATVECDELFGGEIAALIASS